MCQLTMPAIRVKYRKFMDFYRGRFRKTTKKYTSESFNDVAEDEALDGFVCGSDTIFCIDELDGFDDGHYANYPCMKDGFAVSYAASFGDPHFDEETYRILNERLLKRFAKAQDAARAVFVTGSGTASMEATVMNVFDRGDKVLIVNGGSFGQRFVTA